MNQEIIERLVMDKASGELTPDTSALLEAWLAREPGATAEAAQIEETLRLARRALAGAEAKTVLRPKFRRPAWPRWAAGMAACFFAGLGLGLLPLRQIAVAPPASHFASGNDAGFWSARRLHLSSSTFNPSPPLGLWRTTVQSSRLIWRSPVTKPQTGASS